MPDARRIRTVIVDDEPPALGQLEYLLSKFEDVDIVAAVDSGPDAPEIIFREQPALVFLDIEMPGKNGFQVLKDLVTMPHPPLVVFATAFNEHAIRAFEENTVDYLLKPISVQRLDKTLERVRTLLEKPLQETPAKSLETLLTKMGLGPGIVRIQAEDAGRNLLLTPDEILYFSCQDRRVVVHTPDNAFCCPSETTLEKIEERLSGTTFFRVNRSELINLDYVRGYSPWLNGKYVITLRHREAVEIVLSKSRVKDFKTILGI
ncbi:MAG: LytTR family DNA-binding domain-containing protein [Desulfovibrionaceae bacterium]